MWLLVDLCHDPNEQYGSPNGLDFIVRFGRAGQGSETILGLCGMGTSCTSVAKNNFLVDDDSDISFCLCRSHEPVLHEYINIYYITIQHIFNV